MEEGRVNRSVRRLREKDYNLFCLGVNGGGDKKKHFCAYGGGGRTFLICAMGGRVFSRCFDSAD